MTNLTIEQIPLGDRRLREFVRMPWRLYRGDPNWTPPLDSDYLGSKLLGTVGLLTPQHPYHKDAEVTHFLARRDGEPVGRVSAAINRRFNEHYHSKIGFFGFFETIEDFAVAQMLLDAARDWIKARGMEVMRGPGEYSNATHERQGVLIDGFDTPPTLECTHNPPFYDDYLQRYGLHKAMDYHAYRIDTKDYQDERVERIAAKLAERRGITTRQVNLKDLRNEIGILIDIYNEAWSRNWGFLPITSEEADLIAANVGMVLISDLLRFAYVKGEPAAVLATIPDIYVPLRPRWRWPLDTEPVRLARAFLQRRHIPRLRVWFFGILPQFRGMGIDALLFREVQEYALTHGYEMFEPSLLLETNEAILRISEAMGGERYKTWRIYDMNLA